jgi:hypothetical protein
MVIATRRTPQITPLPCVGPRFPDGAATCVTWIPLPSIDEAVALVPGLVSLGAEAVELMVAPALTAAAHAFPGTPEYWRSRASGPTRHSRRRPGRARRPAGGRPPPRGNAPPMPPSSSPPERSRSPSSPVRACPTPKSLPNYSSAGAPSNTTCTKSSTNSPSAPAANSTSSWPADEPKDPNKPRSPICEGWKYANALGITIPADTPTSPHRASAEHVRAMPPQELDRGGSAGRELSGLAELADGVGLERHSSGRYGSLIVAVDVAPEQRVV